VPKEVLGRTGRQVKFPKNNSDTYVARRWLPYGATGDEREHPEPVLPNGTGDRGNAMVIAHQTQEGVTPSPDSIIPVDTTVVLQQYSCLYGFTDKTYDLYEDDIPEQMITQVGERVTLVNEMILYGALRACTNQYFGGTGTTIATVNGGFTLGTVRKVVKNLQANHAMPVTKHAEGFGGDYGTDPVAEGYLGLLPH
jgi:N4-gp56 family major capsid protein